MAFPSFSKSGVTTMTFSRGNVFPAPHEYQPSQLIGRSYAGTFRVATLRDPDEFFELAFERLPDADHTALLAFFTAINWAAASFTYTDTAGTATVVRYPGGRFSFPLVASGLRSGRLTLMRELS